MKSCGAKSKILLEQQLKSQMIMMKNIKIKFNSDDELPLNKTKEIHSMIIVVKDVFYESNKYYPQFFLDVCLNEV